MSRSRRQRSVIVLLLTACLLLQQLAMSALACTLPLLPAAATSMSMSGSAAMTPECAATMAGDQSAAATDAVCEKQCSPDATSASTPGIPSVPALALPPVLHALALAPATHRCDYASDELFARSDPPARLRYCRLLI